MVLLEINNIDFTRFVVEKTYMMNRKNIFETWVDGNKRRHRAIGRSQVTGSFTMTFPNSEDYDNFEDAIAAVKQNGDAVPITVYINNEKKLTTIDAFFDYQTRLVWTFESTRSPEVATISVTVTER